MDDLSSATSIQARGSGWVKGLDLKDDSAQSWARYPIKGDTAIRKNG